MNALELSDRLARIVSGPMWHGPALGELLADVTPREAAARPIPDVHTIAELTAHVAAWAAIVERRLDGPQPEPADDENFPPSPLPASGDWEALRARLAEAHESLARRVRPLTGAALDATMAGSAFTVREMLHGVVEHGSYHGGQIALLKKMQRAGAPP